MRREEGIAKRCPRCGGSGDVPIIAPDCFVHPEAHPLLQCCPDCNGTGYAENARDEAEEPRAER